jgi:hypothetical protein
MPTTLEQAMNVHSRTDVFDVIIVGGGPAGLTKDNLRFAPLSDSMKHCIMAIAADSDLANVYHPLLGHSFSVESHSGA